MDKATEAIQWQTPGAGMDKATEAIQWQTRIWNQMAPVYVREIDQRFLPVVAHLIARADLAPGQRVLDLGTGTGSVALRAAALVAPGGRVVALDISSEMLMLARQRAAAEAATGIDFREARAEALPLDDGSVDVVLACLSMMYVIDRTAAAREIARVLRPGGRLVAAVWAGPDRADIVLLQQTAGSFAPEPPTPGVGPGALADPTAFLADLAAAGIAAGVETEITEFEFADFAAAWEVLAGVTAAALDAERATAAKAAVRGLMWPDGDGPRRFRNETLFILGRRAG